MFLRVDKLQIELPAPAKQDPNAAAALQELLGGKYGEMSTLGNYLFQSFNFRSKSKLRGNVPPDVEMARDDVAVVMVRRPLRPGQRGRHRPMNDASPRRFSEPAAAGRP